MPWPVATIGEIAEVISGATPKTGVADYWNGDIRWVTPADLSTLRGADIADTPRKITEAGLRSCAARVLPPGSVLLSSRAPIGHVAINTMPMATNQGFKSLIPKAGIADAKYLYHWLQANKALLQSLGNGATFKEVSKAVVTKVEIPLPPIGEQRRIADILDHADALCAKRRAASAALEELTQSIFLDMFGDPMTNPRGLPVRAIGDLGTVVTGNTPWRADETNYGHHIEWIKSDNLGREMILTPAAERLSAKGRDSARVVGPGAVLITCIAGTPASIGRASIADREVSFNQQINAIVLKSMEPMFLWAQLRVCRQLIQQKSTGGMKGLVSKSQLQRVSVLNPSTDSQGVFAARLACVQEARRKSGVAMGESESLFNALQQRAFEGQL